MVTSKLGRTLLSLIIAASLFGCTGSDTDGGGALIEAEDTSGQFVADGGSGGTIRISAPSSVPVGGTAGFSVSLTDPSGAPLTFVRVFCESEAGVAILEPSSGGTAFESTNGEGSFSGVLGGLTPGSFILECRAPIGFNLVDRVQIVNVGDIPDGFDGFPGAAGGNLGGGLLVDTSEDPGDALVVSVSFTDAGGESQNGPIDTTFDTDCEGDGTGTSDPDGVPELENFTVTNYNLSLANGSEEDIEIRTVRFELVGTSIGTPELSITTIVPEGGTASFTGLLIENAPPLHSFVGGDLVIAGTFQVRITITGLTENGDEFTVTDRTTLSFSPINNC